MSLQSMTGFARFDGVCDGDSWIWELRAVNSKGLDLRLRLPPGFENLDPLIRKAVSQRFKRGAIQVSLHLNMRTRESQTELNQDLLTQILALSRRLQRDQGLSPLSMDALLSLRGVIVQTEQEDSAEQCAALQDALARSLGDALGQLERARQQEGRQIGAIITGCLDDIEALHAQAVALDSLTPHAIRDSLHRRLDDLLGQETALSPERLAQEVALLAAKADIREELDRLAAHVDTARDLLEAGGPCGRRLDFLCQELNREANTLCSKSSDLDLTRLGIDLKARIEQLREQVQNME